MLVINCVPSNPFSLSKWTLQVVPTLLMANFLPTLSSASLDPDRIGRVRIVVVGNSGNTHSCFRMNDAGEIFATEKIYRRHCWIVGVISKISASLRRLRENIVGAFPHFRRDFAKIHTDCWL